MDTANINELDRCIRILYRRKVSAILKNIGLYNGQPRLLFHLYEKNGCNQKELSDYLNVSNATITVSLKRMEKCGIIRKVPDRNDLRNNIITLTDKGIIVIDKCKKIFKSINIKMYEGFNHEEIENLQNYYKRIIANLENMDDKELVV
ncbi:MAG: MarR family winged helix-turn-helix transcriptional regulator [Clostridiales bacterium]|mgnify:FL=1|nr:MarR family winged helix-turn-helix transcriptional regulator [Clostridiales bacterium]